MSGDEPALPEHPPQFNGVDTSGAPTFEMNIGSSPIIEAWVVDQSPLAVSFPPSTVLARIWYVISNVVRYIAKGEVRL